MGVQSTRTISRSMAIDRIIDISYMAGYGDYVGIEADTNEDSDYSLRVFVDTVRSNPPSGVNKWTNSMLEELMDAPFYRYSMFDNYRVTEDGK